MKKFSATLLILFSFALTGAAIIKQNNGWKTFDSENYTIQYPPDWRVDTAGRSPGSVSIFSPKAVAGDNFADKVTLLAQEMPGGDVTLDKVAPQIVAMFRDTLRTRDGHIVLNHIEESGRQRLNGMEYHLLIATHEGFDKKWKTKDCIFVNKGTVYNITFMAQQATFNEAAITGDKILNSFRLK